MPRVRSFWGDNLGYDPVRKIISVKLSFGKFGVTTVSIIMINNIHVTIEFTKFDRYIIYPLNAVLR